MADRAPEPARSARQFVIEWGGTATLSVDEIWPNGNAPESPTRDDVIAVMQKETMSVSRLLRSWNLANAGEGIEVDGKDSGLR